MSKVALVTGASSGIGEAIALHLIEEGYKVYGTSRRSRESDPQGIQFLQLDVDDDDSVKKGAASFFNQESSIDLLVNCAGLGIMGAVQVVTFLDVTGIIAGLSLATIGALILPARKRRAKRDLEEKLQNLRTKLVSSLTDQFQLEMKRSAQRVEDTIAPFSRFVRSETEKYSKQQERLEEIEAHIQGMQAHLQIEGVPE